MRSTDASQEEHGRLSGNTSAASMNGWLAKRRRDPKVLVHAAAQAQRAVDYITGAEDLQKARA